MSGITYNTCVALTPAQSILTGLPSHGFTRDPAEGPGATTASKPLCPNETPLNPGPTAPMDPISSNIFQPIATGGPSPYIPRRNDHPVQKQHIEDRDVPIQTNKFYANFFLGSQGFPVWTHPYSLTWDRRSSDPDRRPATYGKHTLAVYCVVHPLTYFLLSM
jgi:hypothetical protein